MLCYSDRLSCALPRVAIRIDAGQDPHEACAEFSRLYTISAFDLLALYAQDQRRLQAETRIALHKVRK